MMFRTIGFALAGICACLVGTASGEIYFVAQEESEPSPSDVIVADGDGVQQGGPATQKAWSCDAGCGGKTVCSAGCTCDWDCPWRLFPETYGGINIGGWVQMGYHTQGANGQGVAFSWNFPAGNAKVGPFNNYPNVVQLQQAWAYAEKVADTGGWGWDWGFRVDYVYGTDGQDIQAYGSQPGNWDTTWDAGRFYGHALPQLYAEVAYNNVKVRAGKFFKIVGYEKAQAPENFFYSHSYSFLLSPYTHTGVVAEWSPRDNLTVVGGWTAGWDTGFDQNGGDMFLGGILFQLSDAVHVAYTTMMGDFGFLVPAPGSDSDAYFHGVVLDVQLTDRLEYVLQTNYMENPLLAPYGPILTINQYAFYTLNCRWAVGGRFEWYHGDTSRNELSNFTVGANYRPGANVVIRPEVRIDVLNELGMQDSTVFGIDAIVTF